MRVFVKAYLCRSDAKAEDLKQELSSANPGAVVQTARAGRMKNIRCLEMLAAQTLQAVSTKSLLAKKPEVDYLLRMAGTSQISKAIANMGARSGRPFLLVALSTKPLKGLRSEDPVEELPAGELTKPELVMIERAALLNVQKG